MIFYRPHLPEVRVAVVLSCHRMAHLRAYTVLLTAEPRRGSNLVLYSSLNGRTVCGSNYFSHKLTEKLIDNC